MRAGRVPVAGIVNQHDRARPGPAPPRLELAQPQLEVRVEHAELGPGEIDLARGGVGRELAGRLPEEGQRRKRLPPLGTALEATKAPVRPEPLCEAPREESLPRAGLDHRARLNELDYRRGQLAELQLGAGRTPAVPSGSRALGEGRLVDELWLRGPCARRQRRF